VVVWGRRLGLLLVACAVLSSIEALYPLFRYPRGRLRRAVPNLMLAVGVVLVNILVATLTASTLIAGSNIGLRSVMRAHPWIAGIAGIAGLDLFAYVAHRLLHKMPIGWRFHCIHHSEPEVDVTMHSGSIRVRRSGVLHGNW
jgi:sterol desaturase/sphingolipid hydroxylase (fatty acid hydroxylase superfamily)